MVYLADTPEKSCSDCGRLRGVPRGGVDVGEDVDELGGDGALGALAFERGGVAVAEHVDPLDVDVARVELIQKDCCVHRRIVVLRNPKFLVWA